MSQNQNQPASTVYIPCQARIRTALINITGLVIVPIKTLTDASGRPVSWTGKGSGLTRIVNQATRDGIYIPAHAVKELTDAATATVPDSTDALLGQSGWVEVCRLMAIQDKSNRPDASAVAALAAKTLATPLGITREGLEQFESSLAATLSVALMEADANREMHQNKPASVNKPAEQPANK